MGELYVARDPAIDRFVAIKVLREGLDNAEVRERFKREARSAGRLRHRNIVTIFDVGEHQGKPFIAMEYIVGETLDDLIRRRAPLPLTRRLEIIEDLCSALQYAHGAGIVHRDVKPSNVMVEADGTVKILDFGIARIDSSGLTRGIIGTLNYMAPEQMEGKPVDARTDIFALGALFYELIAYCRAFPGDVSDGVLTKILAGQPEPLENLLSGLDPSIVGIVNRCLEKNPAHRYASCDEIAFEVAAVRRRLPSTDVFAPTVLSGYDDSGTQGRAALEQAQIHEWVVAGGREMARGALTAASLLVERALSLNSGSPEALALRAAVDEARRHLADTQERAQADAAIADARRRFAAGDHEGALDTLRRFRPQRVEVGLAIDELQGEVIEIARRAAMIHIPESSSAPAPMPPSSVGTHTIPPPVRVARWRAFSSSTWIAAAIVAALVLVSTSVTWRSWQRSTPQPVDVIAANPSSTPPAPANPTATAPPVDVAAPPKNAVASGPRKQPVTREPVAPLAVGPAPPAPQPAVTTAAAPGPTLAPAPEPSPPPSPAVTAPAEPTIEPRPVPPLVTQPAPAAVTPPAAARTAPRPDRNTQSPLWVRIPEGTFTMGCVPQDTACYPNESPRHLAQIRRPFEMMATEVTLGMFRAYVSASGRNAPKQPGWNTDERQPIVNLTWDEAAAFCASVGGRLPTEAEWEYAARGGRDATIYPWGDVPPRAAPNGQNRARLAGSGSGAWPVGSFEPNGYGLYDMAGNVWEWVSDRYGPYPSEEVIDPKGPPAARGRLVRGGSWSDGPRFLRISNRGDQAPASGSNAMIGVRCARNVPR